MSSTRAGISSRCDRIEDVQASKIPMAREKRELQLEAT
jgi:hypothetical protein